MATNPLPTVLERYPKSFEPLGRGQPYRMLRPGRAAFAVTTSYKGFAVAGRTHLKPHQNEPNPQETTKLPGPNRNFGFRGHRLG